jgi:hypothetical protein
VIVDAIDVSCRVHLIRSKRTTKRNCETLSSFKKSASSNSKLDEGIGPLQIVYKEKQGVSKDRGRNCKDIGNLVVSNLADGAGALKGFPTLINSCPRNE